MNKGTKLNWFLPAANMNSPEFLSKFRGNVAHIRNVAHALPHLSILKLLKTLTISYIYPFKPISNPFTLLLNVHLLLYCHLNGLRIIATSNAVYPFQAFNFFSTLFYFWYKEATEFSFSWPQWTSTITFLCVFECWYNYFYF